MAARFGTWRVLDVDAQLNLNSETVAQCYPIEPLCLAPSTSVGEALRQMKERNHATVLVCRDQVLVGIYSECIS